MFTSLESSVKMYSSNAPSLGVNVSSTLSDVAAARSSDVITGAAGDDKDLVSFARRR